MQKGKEKGHEWNLVTSLLVPENFQVTSDSGLGLVRSVPVNTMEHNDVIYGDAIFRSFHFCSTHNDDGCFTFPIRSSRFMTPNWSGGA